MPRSWAASSSSRSAASPPSSGSTVEVVVRVVAVVRGRAEDRGQVERGDAQVLEVVEVLRDPEQVAALEPVVRRRGVPRLERARLADARAGRESVREDLVEDAIRTQSGVSTATSAAPLGGAWPRAGPLEPRTTSRVASRRCSGRPGAVVPDDVEQEPDRLLALAPDRLVDGRQRRVDVLGEVDVVEADDADIAGDRAGPDRAAPASRRSPSRRSSPGRRSAGGRPSQPALERRRPPSMLAGPTTIRSSGMVDAGRLERLAIAAQTPCRSTPSGSHGRRRRRAARPPMISDVAMAERDEVLRGRSRAARRRRRRPSRAPAVRPSRRAPSARRPAGSARPPGGRR